MYAEPMARAVVGPAVVELLQRFPRGREFTTTVSFGGDDFTLRAHVRVRRTTPGLAQVSLACWVVGKDAARYLGDNPPREEENFLPPEGTAVPDASLTARVLDSLATRLNPGAVSRPDGDGHLAIDVPTSGQGAPDVFA
ncbi:hypothetical protein ACIQUZ_33375 [Streptomyces griseus]|uniref:hypothetical protein n=1 Tax=Streptomyces TaxID=1883 RepID=UPI0001C18CD0|nr:hypothetical protein [Streptomyces sp. ACT-1]EGE46054.1 hypothetical protein SACT1_6760 [Streptomyces sp. ACT-1]